MNHKATLALAVLTILCGAFLPYIPQVSAGLAASIMGALGSLGMLLKTYQDPPAKDPKALTTGALLLAVLMSGCASGHLTPEAKHVVTSVDDVARQLCLLAKAEAMGVSVAEVAADVCAAERAFAPFRPYVLSAQREGAIAAGISK